MFLNLRFDRFLLTNHDARWVRPCVLSRFPFAAAFRGTFGSGFDGLGRGGISGAVCRTFPLL